MRISCSPPTLFLGLEVVDSHLVGTDGFPSMYDTTLFDARIGFLGRSLSKKSNQSALVPNPSCA